MQKTTQIIGTLAVGGAMLLLALGVAHLSRGDELPDSDQVFSVPSGFTPAYKIVDMPNSPGDIRGRIRSRIIVPRGLSRDALEANLRHALQTVYEQRHPQAIRIFAYAAGTDTGGPYTAARGEFAPDGNYHHAESDLPLSRFQLVIDTNEAYFALH